MCRTGRAGKEEEDNAVLAGWLAGLVGCINWLTETEGRLGFCVEYHLHLARLDLGFGENGIDGMGWDERRNENDNRNSLVYI